MESLHEPTDDAVLNPHGPLHRRAQSDPARLGPTTTHLQHAAQISALVVESPRPASLRAAISNAPPRPSPARSAQSFKHLPPRPALASHNVPEKTPATHKVQPRYAAKRKAAAITGSAGNKKRQPSSSMTSPAPPMAGVSSQTNSIASFFGRK